MTSFKYFYANQYDSFYKDKDYFGECNLIEELINTFCNFDCKLLLDLGCGTGNHSIELSRRGFSVTGIDLSQEMINLAIAKTINNNNSNSPVWICNDLTKFDTGVKYDVAVMMFAVVGYITKNEELIIGLKNIRKHLKIGSLLICDFWNGSSILSNRPVDRVLEIKTNQGKVIRSSSTVIDNSNQTAEVNFKISVFDSDKLIQESNERHLIRYFYLNEFEHLLSLAGFKLVNTSEFPNINIPLSKDSRSALIVSQAI